LIRTTTKEYFMAKLSEGQSSGSDTTEVVASGGKLQQVETKAPGGPGVPVGRELSSRVPKSVAAWLPNDYDIDPDNPDAGRRGD
jgi:hypothetical protein